MRHAIVALFTNTFGVAPRSVERIAADGSQRAYWRLSGGPHGTVVGAHGPEAEENRAFLAFSRALRAAGLPVAEIYAADEHLGIWLGEDLGDTTLFAALSAARQDGSGAFPASVLASYEKVVEVLPRFQARGAEVIDFSLAYPRPAFDEQSMLWDLNYFKYHFLKLAHVPFREQPLEDDFRRLVRHLLAADTGYFLYRDFQSRNILLRDGEPWFVDYQGGRRGAAQYDIASLLYDAKADLPDDVRSHLLERYLDAFERHAGGERARFLESYPGYVLIRIMQAMGAYGYRGFFERKPRFLESVPYAARNVAGLLAKGLPIELPEIEHAFRHIVDEWAARPVAPAPRGLTVHVASFSYRDGVPADESGNGGGFAFDCRSLANPGRRPEFTGRIGTDPEIVRFLEALPETEAFWQHVTGLVEAHVANFRERQFTDFSVAFGCTGGQHRSVYFAERLGRWLRERHPDVAVEVRHTAQARWKLTGDAAADVGSTPPRRRAEERLADGMIFAAGLGTRLGELGATMPKALIEIDGITMLERTARKLVAAGVGRIVVNVHHHADAIERFLATHDLGVEILVSREPDRPLETGGGLWHARDRFRRTGPLLLHNVDVICDADLAALLATHAASRALATLVVHDRETDRYLMFDELGLCGREDRGKGERTVVRPPRGEVRARAFTGIHACSPGLLDLITERGAFRITDLWLRLAAAGHAIRPWLAASDGWLEIGSPERLAAARAALAQGASGPR
jgi:aminoglycoside/choline kinase family phosphotransferase/dTDP-glucose pyrophosphorylase